MTFITEVMKDWKVELTAGGKAQEEGKIQRGIFLGNSFLLLLFVMEMMLLNYIFRKCSVGYKFSKLLEKINHLMYMEDIKLFSKNEKELIILIRTIRIYSQDIRMEFGIEKCAILMLKEREIINTWDYWKRKLSNKGR